MADRVNPHPGILLYTRIKKSPYCYAARRHGVRLYSVYNHHYHPRLYRDPIEEYWQLLEGVTVWDVGGAERQVEISGPDAFRFTNMLTPRNLARCAVGQCKYAFITDERGGIINDPVLLRLGENHFWLSHADSDVLLRAKGVAYHAGWSETRLSLMPGRTRRRAASRRCLRRAGRRRPRCGSASTAAARAKTEMSPNQSCAAVGPGRAKR